MSNYTIEQSSDRVKVSFTRLPFKGEVNAINRELKKLGSVDYFTFCNRSHSVSLVKVGRYNERVKQRDTRKSTPVVIGRVYAFKRERKPKSIFSDTVVVSLDSLYNV